jgi:hypothetical protein
VDVPSSRILLCPGRPGPQSPFYRDVLGLAIYREPGVPTVMSAAVTDSVPRRDTHQALPQTRCAALAAHAGTADARDQPAWAYGSPRCPDAAAVRWREIMGP